MIASISSFESECKEEIVQKTIPIEESQSTDDNVYLIGRPTLKGFLRFMQRQASEMSPYEEGVAVDDWRAANEIIRKLEKSEAGIADNARIGQLDPALESARAELMANPAIVNGFNTVPTTIGMVELDQLVVYQKHIDLTHVNRLKETLGPTPSMERIFRACLFPGDSQPPVKWSRSHSDEFVFMSRSNDLRFLGVLPLRAGNITDYPRPAGLAGIVGLAVGFGSNFLSAIYAEKRMVLNNGSHRAYALRELGVTHVPCIIEYVSSRDELDVVASGDLREHPDLYLKSRRPSMLPDYFNPRLRKIVPVQRRLQQVTVKFQVDDAYVPDV